MKWAILANALAIGEAYGRCCWSKWGDASSCGGYPTGGSGGICAKDLTKACTFWVECPEYAPGSSCAHTDAATSDDVYKDCNIMQFAKTKAMGPEISTLVAAVVAGDRADFFISGGPWTIFAPSNKAFEELPAGAVDSLLKPENKATLVNLLNYHIVYKRVRSKDWKPAQVVTTVQGETLHVVVDATGKTCPQQPGSEEPYICVSVGPSLKDLKKQVATSEFLLSNAAMYLIDGVLLPPSPKDCKKECDCSCLPAEYRHPSRRTDGSCWCTGGTRVLKCCGKSDILV